MIHGKWRVHTLCKPNDTKMAHQIVIISRASHTAHKEPPYIPTSLLELSSFTIFFFSSGEQPEQRIAAHKL